MSTPETAPYEALAAMIERELELIGDSRLEELAQLKLARTELLRSMPVTPPAAAHEALERCALLQQRVRIEILRVREAVLLELAQLERVRRTAEGYAPRRTRPRISASA
jgi:hypothetical protein